MPGNSCRSVVFLICAAALLAGCGGGRRAQIFVNHSVALWDQPIRIEISGLAPQARVVLSASADDAAGRRYVSSTAERADARGSVELSDDAAMRVLWSLAPDSGGDQEFDYLPPRSGELVTLSAGGATTTVRRIGQAAGLRVRLLRPAAAGLYGEYFTPPNSHRRQPGVLLFGGSEGGLSPLPEAALYASHGYPTLALAYFGEPGLPQNLARIPLEYFARALHWLGKQQDVDPGKLVVEGISRGSEAAQLLGIYYPQLVHAVIAMVPSNGAVCGIPRVTSVGGGSGCIGPAWTIHGRAIPYSDLGGASNPHPFADERIDGPLFIDCGGGDQLWPSCPMAHAIVSRLRARHFQHPVTFLDYALAGHGVGSLLPYLPGRVASLEGQTANANQVADANGWPKLLRFLADLRKHGPG